MAITNRKLRILQGAARAKGGGGGALPAFAYQAETEAITTAFSAAPTRRVKRSIDWAVKTLKTAGILQKHFAFNKVGNDQQSSLINWAQPGVKDAIIVGTPGFVANSHFAPAASTRIRTQISLTDIDPANVTIWYLVRNAVSSSTSDIGALGANGYGLSLCASNTSNSLTGRCGSANQTTFGVTGAGGDWGSGTGFKALTRTNSSNVQAYNGPVKRDDITLASQAMQNNEIVVLAINNNGTFTQGARQVAAWGICQGLTEAEMEILGNVVQQLDREYLYGAYDTYDAGTQPANLTFDTIVYGATPAGLADAVAAKRLGDNVAILRGANERHVGGMMASGLGATDFTNKAKIGGWPRYIMSQMQAIEGKTATDFTFDPNTFDQKMRNSLDPRNSDGFDIPIFDTDGIASVQWSGARITSIKTVDGRTFTAPYFADWSYEGDLLVAAGTISKRLGREPQSEFGEPGAGFRGTLTTGGSTDHQYKDAAGNLINVDPYITPGNPASGILPSLQGTMGVGTPANGAGDSLIQSYNKRISATTVRTFRKPFPSTPPAGFDAMMYEPLLRRLAIDPTISMDDIFLLNVVTTACLDINAFGGFSTDKWGAASAYPPANAATRRTIEQAHWNHILGLFYVLQYHADARVPSALRTEALTYGLHMHHYCDSRAGRGYQEPPQLYARETYRLDNDFMLRYDDMMAADGTTPRSIKITSMASYPLDSHHIQSFADPNGGTPRIWNEGGFYISTMGGANSAAPVPYEVMLPRKTECENLIVGWCAAVTHVAMGALRMELTSMQNGQSAAHAMHVARTNGNQALQDVDYPTMRASILAQVSLPGETAAILDQVN